MCGRGDRERLRILKILAMLNVFESANTRKCILIRHNGNFETKKEIYIEPDWQFDEFLRSAGQALNIRAHYAFNVHGVEIDDCMVIGDRDIVVLSHDKTYVHAPLLVTQRPVDDVDHPSSVPSIVGPYAVGRLLGKGGFGEVRLGTHQFTNEFVALKFALKSDIQCLADADRSTKEFQVLASMKHRNIIKMLSREELPNHVVLTFELCGTDLHRYLMDRGPKASQAALSNAEARLVFGQLLAGVSYAHSLRIIHRDLKVRLGFDDCHCGWFYRSFCGLCLS